MEIEHLKELLKKIPIENLRRCVYRYSNMAEIVTTTENLRKYHNWIKSTLMNNVVLFLRTKKNAKFVSLLDIAVGRGGDIFKWDKSGINKVFGFDKSAESIAEAKKRLATANVKTQISLTTGDATFPAGSPGVPETDPRFKKNIFSEIKENNQSFQIVSCQFAIHYFFRNEVAIRNVLNLVSNCLAPGGLFIGTTFNSKDVLSLLKKYNNEDIHQDLFTLVKNFKTVSRNGYGNGYTFYFNEENTGLYFDNLKNKEQTTEYLVDFSLLEKLAKEYNLHISKTNFFDIDNSQKSYFTPKLDDKYYSFQSLYTLWESNARQLTEEEKEVSFLNSVFIFEKVS